MGSMGLRASANARQTPVRRGQHYVEKLVSEVAQRSAPRPEGAGQKGAFVSSGHFVLGRSRCSKDIVRSMSGSGPGLSLWALLREPHTLVTAALPAGLASLLPDRGRKETLLP